MITRWLGGRAQIHYFMGVRWPRKQDSAVLCAISSTAAMDRNESLPSLSSNRQFKIICITPSMPMRKTN